MTSRARGRWASVGFALTALLAGCTTATVTPGTDPTTPGPLTRAQASGLVDGPIDALASTLKGTAGAPTFTRTAGPEIVRDPPGCFYRSAVYESVGAPTREHWRAIAGAAAPQLAKLAMDTSGWLTDQTYTGRGLVAANPANQARFSARGTAVENAAPGAASGLRLEITVPLAASECG